MTKQVLLSAALLTSLTLAACLGDDGVEPERITCDPVLTQFQALTGDTVTTASGLKYIDMEGGTGTNAVAGGIVRVHYSGYLAAGTRFETSCPGEFPVAFRLLSGQVIPGFLEGIIGMRAGGVRRLIIPPSLAYGSEDVRDRNTGAVVIPANSTLVFDVELVQVQ